MKALVLAGGSGSRLRPFTFTTPKQLLPIANRPLLELVVENVAELGVEEVGIVVGDRAEAISVAIGDGTRFGVRISYIRQERPLGLAHAVAVSRPFLGDDDFVLHLGDAYLRQATLVGAAAEFGRLRPAAHVLVRKVLDPTRFGVVVLGPDGAVRDMEEKPAQPHSDLALTGVYFLTPLIHTAVAAIRPSPRGELELTDALQHLVDTGARVTAAEYAGYWRDIGTVEDLLACHRNALEMLVDRCAGDVDHATVLHGRVVVEPGALVRRSRIEGPTVIAAGAVVEDSHVGPNVALGASAQVRGSRVEESILLAGATVTGVPALRDSVIGRDAVVRRSVGTPNLGLVVGDHGRVEVVDG